MLSSCSGSNGFAKKPWAPTVSADTPASRDPLITMIGTVRVRGLSRSRSQ